MKNIQYQNKNMQRICQYGLAAMIFWMGTLPVQAQEEADVAAPVKKEAKAKAEYEMMEVKGRVYDAATGEVLAGVQLQAYNNASYTAMTDDKGVFTIKVPTFVTSVTAKLEGYNLVRAALGNAKGDIIIALYSDRYLTNYAARTSGSKSVSISDFGTTTSMTADQEIQNRLGADVHSISRSALPGQGVAMFINGFNSLNSNAQPLVVVDGVIQDQMYDSDMLHSGYYNNLLAGINMDDIASVEVLKNGTAIYGAKAANGVILIKTKRNTSMATRIDVNIAGSYELIPETMDVMNAGEYRRYASGLLAGTGTKELDFAFLDSDNSRPYYNKYHNNTDWKDEVYQEAFTQNYSINIQGGDDIANYNLSVGFMDGDATLKMNDITRFNIRFNTDVKFNEWFTTRFDAAYTNITRDMRDSGWGTKFDTTPLASTSALALIKAPFLSPYAFTNDGILSSFYDDADDYLNGIVEQASLANPTAILENGEAKNKNYSDNTFINLTIAPKWQPNKNFSLTETFNYSMQSFDETYFTPIKGMPNYRLDEIGVIQNTKELLYTNHTAVFSDTRADWALPLGAHRLDIFGGIRFMNDSYTASDLIGYNTGNDKTPNLSNALSYKFPEGLDNSWRSLSYYANVDYNYKERYYLQASMSMETSSRFGKDVDAGLDLCGVPWGLFPSVQAAWVVTNEKWFKPNKGINFLKFNAGFESVGNDALDNNANITYMQSHSMLNNTMTDVALTNIGNTKLRWETTNRFNAGVEGNFFNNRLNLKFNYYTSKTTNLVTLGTLAYVSGLSNYWTNDGEMENRGYDFAFNAKLINAPKFKMELGGSIGHYKNEITKLPGGGSAFTTEIYDGTILTQVGQPVGVFYGYETNGVYSTTQEAQDAGKYIVDRTGKNVYFQAGDMKFVDQDGMDEINEADRVIIGDPNPDIFGNINANFYIGKSWTVSARFNYSLGNDVYNFQRYMLERGSSFMNQTTAMNARWTTEGQVTSMPKATYNDPMGNSRFSDRWIEDGSYLKLKNVTVSYKLPIRNEYIQGITVWGAANNLFTLTEYLGADPEVYCGNGVLMQGIDAGFLTPGRSFTLGVKIGL